MIVTKREPDKKPPSTKQMPEALQILRRGIWQRGDSDIFEQHRAYEEMIMMLTEEEKIQSTPSMDNHQTLISYYNILLLYL